MHGTTQAQTRWNRRGVVAVAAAAALALGAGGAATAALPPVAAADPGGRLVVDEAFTQRVAAAVEGQVNTVIEVSSGGYLVGGHLAAPDDEAPAPGGVVRLQADGTPDAEFNARLGSGAGWDEVTALTETADGGFVVGGRFGEFNGHETECGLVRLHPDGTLDATFVVDESGPCGTVHTVVEARDGDLLVGGFFTMPTGDDTWLSSFARLNPDGSPATGYNTGLGSGFTGGTIGSGVFDVVEMADGGVVVGGHFHATDDEWGRSGLARINPDGTYDAEFLARLGQGNPGPSVNAVTQTSDGQVLVAGGSWWDEDDDLIVRELARLHPGGAVDTTFQPAGEDDSVEKIAELSDGTVLAAGWFDDEHEGRSLAVIRPDGTTDRELSGALSSAADGWVTTVRATSDGGALVGGDFWDPSGGRGLVKIAPAP